MRRLSSCVRLALVTSVMCSPPAVPPVSRHARKLSMVPKRISPASARFRSAGTFSSSQRILRLLKYVESGRPVVRRATSSWDASSFRYCSVRVSCQTMALATGAPVLRSHRMVVSRWFVMPIAAKSLARRARCVMASSITCRVRRQISSGSCSTHPGRG